MSLPERKKYTAPFWTIIGIVLLRMALTGVIVYSLYDYFSNYDQDLLKTYAIVTIKNMLISDGTFILVLLLEAIVYWRIRYLYIRRTYAWLHITGLALAIFVVPTIYNLYVSKIDRANDTAGMIHLASQIRVVILGGLFIVAHMFFALLLIDVYKKRKLAKETVQPEQESPDILNDYVS